ncbi:MAG TPA: hypothetical protein VG106_07650 [Vicinamibacterales bacterium]|nr:hypothetical protein [Vicinamibacterales bacterium]
MSWGGQMTCNIINNTGGAITNVTFSHEWNGGAQEPIFGTDPFPDGGTAPFTIQVGDGGSDLWSVQFTDADGNCWYRKDKQCDVSEDDFTSGNPVNAVLKAGKVGFSIELPVSTSCPDNYYDSCS